MRCRKVSVFSLLFLPHSVTHVATVLSLGSCMYPMGFLSGKEAAISDSIISQCGNGPLDNEWRTALSLVDTWEGENGIEWEYPSNNQGGFNWHYQPLFSITSCVWGSVTFDYRQSNVGNTNVTLTICISCMTFHIALWPQHNIWI